jgi:hypothetical protein
MILRHAEKPVGQINSIDTSGNALHIAGLLQAMLQGKLALGLA